MAPPVSYHNLYEDLFSNVMMEVSAEALLGPARVYGEFVLDDIVMAWEDPDARSTAFGFSCGLEWKLLGGKSFDATRVMESDFALREPRFGTRGGLSLIFEHYRTTTYLYNRETSSGKWTLSDYRLVDTSSGYVDAGDAFYLGFPFGPDCALDALSLRHESERLCATFSLRYLRRGSYGIGSAYPPEDGASTWFELQTPVSRSLVVDLSADWALSRAFRINGAASVSLGDDPAATISAEIVWDLSVEL